MFTGAVCFKQTELACCRTVMVSAESSFVANDSERVKISLCTVMHFKNLTKRGHSITHTTVNRLEMLSQHFLGLAAGQTWAKPVISILLRPRL